MNAHLLSHGADYRSAGIHGYISNLLRHLPAEAGKDLWRFEAHVGRGNTAALDGIHFRRSRMDTDSPWRRILWEQTVQPRELRGIDLYHAMAFVAPLWLPAPMVVTVYDLSFIRYPDRLSPARRMYLRAMTALTCQRARRVIAISQATANELSALLHVPKRKIDVTPLGYDNARFYRRQPAEIDHFRRKQGLPDSFWLYVGTLEPRKNLLTLLKAYSLLDKDARKPLILGGGLGWRGERIIAAIEALELQDSVKHVGFIPSADLPLWYNCAEIFVYPSLYEGFGLPALEAMACGAPIITSDTPALTEVMEDAGKAVKPDDIPGFAATLKVMSEEEDWRRMLGEYGRSRARLFSWKMTALLTLRSYLYAYANEDPEPLDLEAPASVSSDASQANA